MKIKKYISANNQYLGTCLKCNKRPEALLEGFCQECQKKYKKEFEEELIKMGYDLK